MNELKSVYIDRTGDWVRSGNDTGKFYLKKEVDAVIADIQKTNVILSDNAVNLNRELDELKKRSSCTFSDDCLRVRHLKRENEQLKAKLESVQASMYCDVVDANMENRRLKRALWLSRALRARDKAFEYHFKNNVEMCAKWDNVHLMLMAKAEEYK